VFHQDLRWCRLWVGGFLVGEDEGLSRFTLLVATPVRLEKDGIDPLEIDGLGAVADGLDHGADAEVAHRARSALGASRDEAEGLFGEGAVGEADEIELSLHEGDDVAGSEAFDFGGVGIERSEMDRTGATWPAGVRPAGSIKCGI